MNLSCVIMTHRQRIDQAVRLREELHELAPRIVVAEEGTTETLAETARRCWAAVDPSATHHLVVQDDVEVAPDFVETVHRAVAERPESVLCLFTEWASVTSHLARAAAWVGVGFVSVSDAYVPTVATVLPAGVAREMSMFPAGAVQDDVALAQGLAHHGVRALVVVGGGVEHLEGASLAGNDGMGARHAAVSGIPRLVGHHPAKESILAGCVPALSRSYPRPFGLVRSADDSWTPHPIGALVEPGVDLTAAVSSAIRESPDAEGLRDVLTGVDLASLATVAWGLGRLVARATGPEGRERLWESNALGRQGLRTLGGGYLDGRPGVAQDHRDRAANLVSTVFRAALMSSAPTSEGVLSR
ncbi:hypothetical protein [Oerskovia turbata]